MLPRSPVHFYPAPNTLGMALMASARCRMEQPILTSALGAWRRCQMGMDFAIRSDQACEPGLQPRGGYAHPAYGICAECAS